jgi:hypothetical protein
LHIDNASQHLAESKFDSMGIRWLSHPLYSPDIGPCDFWLFGYFKMNLEGMFFDTSATLLAEIEDIFGDISIIE